jgi:hypothetical protein
MDDSLSGQVGSFDTVTKKFQLDSVPNCGDHPHDGLNLDPANHPWWDEEFANSLGELIR